MFDKSTLKGGWYIAMETREFRSGPVAEIEQVDWDNLLELRGFTQEHEIKWVRGGLNAEPQIRDSADIQFDESREEEHYLDIDTTKSAEPGYVYAIGGGRYRLPDTAAKKMKIQVYYRADDKGFYQPFDFRIVHIGKEGI